MRATTYVVKSTYHHLYLPPPLQPHTTHHTTPHHTSTTTPAAPQYGHNECIRILFWHLGPENVRTHKGIATTLALTAAKGFVDCVRELRVHIDFSLSDLAAASGEASRWGRITQVRSELDRPAEEYLGRREALHREWRWRERKWLLFVHHRHYVAFIQARMRGSRAQAVPDMSSLPPYLLRLVARFLV